MMCRMSECSTRDIFLVVCLLQQVLCRVEDNLTDAEMEKKDLLLGLYKVYPDTAVLDWFISLQDKDKMDRCEVTYGPVQNHSSVTLIENFLPQHRSFSLHPLAENQTYWFNMVCTDNKGVLHSSDHITFTTEVRHGSVPRVGARYSRWQQQSPEDKWPQAVDTDFRSKFLLTTNSNKKISPHVVMGAACGVVGFVIINITLVLVFRRYSEFRRQQTQHWEQQLAENLEAMPSFISGSSPELRSLAQNLDYQPVPLEWNEC